MTFQVGLRPVPPGKLVKDGVVIAGFTDKAVVGEDDLADLPYSEETRCYLACQMELELAMESLLRQLEEAGKLDDTVIVLSADHYPYGLTDEQYSELRRTWVQ